MPVLAKILIASAVGGLFALAGGVILLFRAGWVRRFALHFTSYAVGVLLAAAFLDLLPEALEFAEEPRAVLAAALAGIVLFFILERLIFKFHPHHHGESGDHHHALPALLMAGDTAHNFIDGVLIAISFLTDPGLGVLATFAVLAHELPQEISDFSIMLKHGWSHARVLWGNVLSSLASVAGALLAFAGRSYLEPVLPQLLGFTAGIFIYIAASDLMADISEEEFRDKTWHVIVLLALGIATIWALGTLIE